jgi:hypothetical protein
MGPGLFPEFFLPALRPGVIQPTVRTIDERSGPMFRLLPQMLLQRFGGRKFQSAGRAPKRRGHRLGRGGELFLPPSGTHQIQTAVFALHQRSGPVLWMLRQMLLQRFGGRELQTAGGAADGHRDGLGRRDEPFLPPPGMHQIQAAMGAIDQGSGPARPRFMPRRPGYRRAIEENRHDE